MGNFATPSSSSSASGLQRGPRLSDIVGALVVIRPIGGWRAIDQFSKQPKDTVTGDIVVLDPGFTSSFYVNKKGERIEYPTLAAGQPFAMMASNGGITRVVKSAGEKGQLVLGRIATRTTRNGDALVLTDPTAAEVQLAEGWLGAVGVGIGFDKVEGFKIEDRVGGAPEAPMAPLHQPVAPVAPAPAWSPAAPAAPAPAPAAPAWGAPAAPAPAPAAPAWGAPAAPAPAPAAAPATAPATATAENPWG